MANNSQTTSRRVFKISKLASRIAVELIKISRKSVLDLACASQDLEQPVMSVLWVEQQSLRTLLKVLPEVKVVSKEGGGECGLVR